MSIQVLNAGTRVKTVIGNIEALITGTCMRGNHIYYELSYFVNGDHKNVWLYRFEIEVLPEKRQAGFNVAPENFEHAQLE